MDGSAEHQEGPLEPQRGSTKRPAGLRGTLHFGCITFYIIPTNEEYSMIYIPFIAKPSLYTAITPESMMPLWDLDFPFADRGCCCFGELKRNLPPER